MPMPRLAAAALAALVLAALPRDAAAQVDVRVNLLWPTPPSLVVIQPGVQVVEGYDDEVFVHGGAWWMRRGPVWYRAPHRGAAFVVVRERDVPVVLHRLPPGQYRRWKADKKELKREAKEAHREQRERDRDERHDKHEGKGHGKKD